MGSEFVHLHVHTQYSMLDGAIRVPALVARTAEFGMPAVAITDHGNMFGAVQFHNACSKYSASNEQDIKPILGCEVNVTPGDRSDPNERRLNHLILLAASQQGYQNLVQLVSRGWVDGLQQGRPRIDLELLHAHHTGLVALTGCMGGLVPQAVLMRGPEAGNEVLGQLRDALEPGHLFVELTDHGFDEQGPLNEILVELAQQHQLPTVATNVCHFMERTDARAQLVLQCIAAGRTVADMEASHHGSDAMYFASAEEMQERFRHYPEAVRNTLRVAEMCAGEADPLAKPQLPRFAVPETQSEDAYLRELAQRGLAERIERAEGLGRKLKRTAYDARLAIELDVICDMGFAGYFLIVQDFINWAKQHDVPVGPGRGSGAGSLVAYALRITDLDPIPYGLLFERFLNPERVSMPDFDIDFCMDKRDRVIDYVREKYGETSVGQIATFHLLKSRSVVRDVGRVMGLSPADAGRIATLIPEPVQGKSVSIDAALKQEPRLKAAYEDEERTRELLDTAQRLEDLTRHAGMHAAGVVISEGPLWDHVPVFCPEPDVYVTQYSKDDVEAAGLVKFDFLGLKTLTVIDIAVQLINQRPDRSDAPFAVDTIPLDDKATFALLRSGETTNVFQLESSGMQTLFKQLRPDCFEDIVAAVALYRPGPLGSGMVEDFVQRKHGRVPVAYPHESLKSVLKETYGVIVYQEQVMQIARQMAGYSLGGADLLRRAMGKKKAEEMAKQKAVFLKGAQEQGYSQEDADRVFELMAYFAGYGFNKSHSAAYALITYQTAFLKAHFPAEFVCATLSADKDKIDKVVRTIGEGRSMGITVLPPDVNESAIDFTVVYASEADPELTPPKHRPVCQRGKVRDPLQPKIRFGLGAIKGIGGAALEAVLAAREQAPEGADENDGKGAVREPFADLFDFCARVDLRPVNKAGVESLVQCGAFDAAHAAAKVNRAQAYAAIDAALERGRKLSAERNSGQTSLLGLLGGDTAGGDGSSSPAATYARGVFAQVEGWDARELLAREKGALGFYVSGHPLDRYAKEIARFCTATTESLIEMDDGQRVSVGGTVEALRERNTRAGARIAFFSLEDSHGRAEVIVRPRILEQEGVRETLNLGEPVVVNGMVQHERERGNDEGPQVAKVVLDEVSLLGETITKQAKAVHVRVHVERLDELKLQSLHDTLKRFPGKCPVRLELAASDWAVSMPRLSVSVNPTEALVTSIERVFGESVCELR